MKFHRFQCVTKTVENRELHLVSPFAPIRKIVVVNFNMLKLMFLVFVCIKISTGYFEGLASINNFPSTENSGTPKWPVPVHYGEPQIQRRKPCPHRRSNSQAGELWIPSFKSIVSKPLDNNVLEPQALKHDDAENTVDESKVTEIVPTVELSPNNESNTVPSTEPLNDSIILDRTNRRSNVEESLNNSGEQPLSEDYDCYMDLNTKDYFDSQDGIQEHSKTSSNGKPLAGVEQKVIEMLRECINKKQKYIEDQLNQGEGVPIAGSRRSMGDLDNDADVNKNSNASSVPIKEHEPSHNLRPGRLFNELKNPARTTGIAEISPSRRMPADDSRICYACSTATNPSCWEPNSKTTIKYCSPNQNCITKSLGEENSLTILRDCATSCDAAGIPGIEPKYKSCSLCYNDYCNSAATNNYNLAIIFLITAIKCTF